MIISPTEANVYWHFYAIENSEHNDQKVPFYSVRMVLLNNELTPQLLSFCPFFIFSFDSSLD